MCKKLSSSLESCEIDSSSGSKGEKSVNQVIEVEPVAIEMETAEGVTTSDSTMTHGGTTVDANTADENPVETSIVDNAIHVKEGDGDGDGTENAEEEEEDDLLELMAPETPSPMPSPVPASTNPQSGSNDHQPFENSTPEKVDFDGEADTSDGPKEDLNTSKERDEEEAVEAYSDSSEDELDVYLIPPCGDEMGPANGNEGGGGDSKVALRDDLNSSPVFSYPEIPEAPVVAERTGLSRKKRVVRKKKRSTGDGDVAKMLEEHGSSVMGGAKNRRPIDKENLVVQAGDKLLYVCECQEVLIT